MNGSATCEVGGAKLHVRASHSALRTCVAGIALVLGFGAAPALAQAPSGGGAPVAARQLPRGAVVTAEDVVGGSAIGQGGPEGWVTRRVIAAGEVLREPAIMRPDVVKTGDVVQLVYRQGAVELRMVGRALGSAARGEKVQVRVDSRRRFSGVVVDAGTIRMEAGERER